MKNIKIITFILVKKKKKKTANEKYNIITFFYQNKI